MEILRFLKAHPLIKLLLLEKMSGIPLRTLRLNEKQYRPIPECHNEKLTDILKEYGYHIIKLGENNYLPGDIVHFSIGTDTIYEAQIIWDTNSFRYTFEPTGRTEWLPWLEIINTNWIYYE